MMWLSPPLSFLTSLQMTTTRSWQVSTSCHLVIRICCIRGAGGGGLPALHKAGYCHAACFNLVHDPQSSRQWAAHFGQWKST